MTNVTLGGWSGFQAPLTAEAQNTFNHASQGLLGVKYEAVAFASQMVAGLNYSFLCNAQVVTANAPKYSVLIQVYQPLPGQGDAHITSITRVNT